MCRSTTAAKCILHNNYPCLGDGQLMACHT